MEFTTILTGQDSPIDATSPFALPFSSETMKDHVRWQGSQTACQALNQLIKSSANEDGVGTSGGWQRQSSFDQIPGFSLLSSNETVGPSGSLSAVNASSSTKPSSSRSSRPSLSRARLSDARTRGPAGETNLDPSGLPFFNKTNPAQFLDMLKGVSARLDENVGARRKDFVGSTSRADKAKKRARGASLGVPSELLAGKTKSRRMDGAHLAGGLPVVEKGKARAVSASGSTWDMHRREGASFRDTSSHLDSAPTPNHVPDDSSMDVYDSHRSIASPSFDLPPATFFQASGSCSTFKTPSQAEMPPPALPTKHPSVTHATPQSSAQYQSQPLPVDLKPRKTDPIPKLHPLLQQKAPQSKSPGPTSSANSNPVPSNNHAQTRSSTRTATPQTTAVEQRSKVDPQPQVHPPLATTTLGPPTSTPSNRPPVLGMRRTHTYPSRPASSGLSNQPFGNNASNMPLPTRQKGFKPPLLSNSQPQPQSQAQSTAAVAVNTRPQPPFPAQNSNGSVKVEASGSSTSSGSQSSARSDSSSTSHSISGSGFNTSMSSIPSSTPTDVPASDTDPDSSFGDMSFDMDALEETMKMYD